MTQAQARVSCCIVFSFCEPPFSYLVYFLRRIVFILWTIIAICSPLVARRRLLFVNPDVRIWPFFDGVFVFFLWAGMSVNGNQTYSSVRPEVEEISSTEITISWTAPVDTGKSPVTGYHVSSLEPKKAGMKSVCVRRWKQKSGTQGMCPRGWRQGEEARIMFPGLGKASRLYRERW